MPFWIVLAEAVGALSGWLTRKGVKIYNATVEQPPLSPPSIVFPMRLGDFVCTHGYWGCAGLSGSGTDARSRSLLLFLVQLVFNFFWSIIFFNLQAFGFAFLWLIALWVLILLMILSFRKVDKPAAWLQIPYLLWVTFAAYLNFGVWLLNR